MSKLNRPKSASARRRRNTAFASLFEGLEQRRLLAAVGVSAFDATASEQALSTGKFRFTRDETAGALTVNFTISGTATNGTDYNTLSQTVNFANGAATVDVTVTPKEDTIFEGDETVIVTLAESENYEIDEDATEATITIADNDKPAVSIVATDNAANEAEDEEDIGTGKFTLTRTGSTAAPLTVKVNITGTATNGSDYETIATTVTFPADESTVEVEVTPKDDSALEAPETVILTIAADAAYTFTAGATSTATVTITDNEVPTLSVVASDATALEGSATDTGKFTITRNGPTVAALTVNYTMSGVGVNGTDYDTLSGAAVIPIGKTSVDVILKTKQDTNVEGVETAILTLVDAATYDLDDAKKAATVNINDDDKPVISIVASDATAYESGNNTNASFTVSRTGVTTSAITIPFVITGTATKGSDYKSIPASITIPKGKSSVLVKIKAKDDDLLEASETVILTLGTGAAFLVNAAQKTATVTIHDDEKPDVSIVATDATAAEPNKDKGAFTVTRNGPTVTPLTVKYTITGTATNGTDMDTIADSVVIPAGKASAVIAVNPKDDDTLEGSESVILTLDSDAAYEVDATADTAMVKILDNEKPTVTVHIGSDTAEEKTDGNYGRINIVRTGGTMDPLTVPIVITGTATNGVDYVKIPTSVTIPANAGSASVWVEPIADTLIEGSETIIATIAPNAAYIVGTDKSGTVTLVDDEKPTVSIVATDPTAAEPADKGVFTITRNGLTTSPLVVKYTITGTATAGDDYNTLTGTVTIPAGKASATVDVVVKQDTTLEGRETVIVTLDDEDGDAVYLLDSSKDDATVNIMDDELPEVSLVATDATIDENPEEDDDDATGIFTFTRTGPTTDSLEVLYGFAGTAVTGVDTTGTTLGGKITIPAGHASAKITLRGRDDDNYEGNETIILTLKPSAKIYTVHATEKAATATVIDDDTPRVSLVATKATAKEKGDKLTFNVVRDGAVTAPLTVKLSLGGGGTASSADVVALPPTTVTIPAGKAFSTVTITAKDDAIYEGTEKFDINIEPADDDAYIPTEARRLILEIVDDEVPTLTITADDANAAEEDAATGAFLISRGIPGADPLVVNIGLMGNAKNGKDYHKIGKTVTIPAGAQSVFVTVVPKADSTVEGTETVKMELKAGTGYKVGTTDQNATVSIADAQTPTVSVSVDQSTISENDAGGTWFRISRDGRTLNGPLVVMIQLTGTGSLDQHFAWVNEEGEPITSNAITIPAGESFVDLYAMPLDNDDSGDDKTVIVKLVDNDAYEIDDEADEATLTIEDDED